MKVKLLVGVSLDSTLKIYPTGTELDLDAKSAKSLIDKGYAESVSPPPVEKTSPRTRSKRKPLADD